ncbi:hypothetical protein MXD81_10005, partial [Microbacteriaceae bacterium K1510]|nr:hypothetical protein [Microbacteriaceae bacterium K1510]
MTQSSNSFGEIIETRHSDGWRERNEYDGFGNITDVRNNEGGSHYQYDKIDRIEEETGSRQAKPIAYEYDERGNRKTVVQGKYPLPTEERTQKYDAL